MLYHTGGGTLISIVGAEASTREISKTFEKGVYKFSSWFKSNPQVAGNLARENGNAWESLKSFSSSAFAKFEGAVKVFIAWVKKDRRSWITSLNNLQELSNTQNSPKEDWKNFFNGLTVLLHLSYRDVFKVQFGTVLSLLLSLLVDIEGWKWTVEHATKAFKELDKRFEKGSRSLLAFLKHLNEMAQFERKRRSKGNSGNNKHIEINIRNVKWFGTGANYVTEGDEK